MSNSDLNNEHYRKPRRNEPRDRLILILKLFLPLVIFLVGIMIILSKQLLLGYPVWQKNSVGVLFIIYAVFRFYQAIQHYTIRNEEE